MFCCRDVCLFYTDRPGAHYERRSTMKKKQRKSQNNIISCVEFCPDDSMFACGCYDGTIGIYSLINGHLLDLTAAHSTGITCIKFSKDGYHIYTGVRNAESIKCWDISNIQTPIFTINRTVTTNQRIYFDLKVNLHSIRFSYFFVRFLRFCFSLTKYALFHPHFYVSISALTRQSHTGQKFSEKNFL